MVNNKIKGLLKGLRYISQIFEEEEEEKEMQIGYPTDVKHLAHIGSNGSSLTPSSWMGGYQLIPLNKSVNNNEDGWRTLSQDTSSRLTTNAADTPAKNKLPHSPAKRRHRHRSSASNSPPGGLEAFDHDKEPTKRGTRHSRRHLSSGASAPASSSSKEPSDGDARCGPRHSKISASGGELPARDTPPTPMHSTRGRRKSKELESSSDSSSSSLYRNITNGVGL